uniref:CSON015326 protein n=1 Tax=Culicoides sonorensis TaxID=179676 RepID=A0A336LPG1_CULSO
MNTMLRSFNERVGKISLSKAPILKSVHQTYCASHLHKLLTIISKVNELQNLGYLLLQLVFQSHFGD